MNDTREIRSRDAQLRLQVEELLKEAEYFLSVEVLADNVVKMAACRGEVVALKKVLDLLVK